MKNELEVLREQVKYQQVIIDRQAAELARVDHLISEVYRTLEQFKASRIETENRFKD